jgi:N-acetylglucosaminyl-diphospho-decaprenol L-rhamnosyltransferase
MDIAAIVVTHNQHDVLRTCLRSVFAAMEGVDGEVIVVDNQSTDATPQVVTNEFPAARYIRNDVNLYYTRAVNQGMRATSAEFVFLLNDDTEMEPQCVRHLIEFMRAHPKCGAVGPALRSPTHELQTSAQRFPTPYREFMTKLGIAYQLRKMRLGAGMQKQYPEPLGTRQVDWVCGGATFFRRALMEEVGYHDEHYLFYRDDPDIGMRLVKRGWEVWYCPETYLLHHHGKSTVKTPRRVRFEIIDARSRRHYYRKFHGWLAMMAVESAYLTVALLRALKSAVLFRFAKAGQDLRTARVLFEAIAMPEEERNAYAGYGRCAFNGLTQTDNIPNQPAPAGAGYENAK